MPRRQSTRAALIITETPETDRTQVFTQELAAIVRASTTLFVRFAADGSFAETLLGDGPPSSERRLEWLQSENLLQERAGLGLPRISDSRISLDGRRGLVALYGIDQTLHGMALFVRTRPFTNEERDALEATLVEGSELLRRLSSFEGEHAAEVRTAERTRPAQYILARDGTIELEWIPPDLGDDDAFTGILALCDGLPPIVRDAVRDLTAGWTDDTATHQPGTAVPLPFMVVHTAPLTAADGSIKIGVTVERYRSRNPLRGAVEKYAISARELEVLALVLKGYGTTQIAETLTMAESTAHDHIKRMMLKTRARNRVELASKVLGWRAS